METKYCNTLVSSREDGKLANTDNIYDKEIGEMQNIINKRFIDFMEKLGINITVNNKGQHIWTVGTSQYILTPYTEAAVVVSTDYDKPIITGFSYRNAVSNNGGKASVGSLTFTQKVTYTWNNGTQTFDTIDGNLDTEALEVTYTISDILNNARVDEFGNVEADVSTVANSRTVCKITPQVTLNGKTSSNVSVFAEVAQAGAVCTFAGGGTTYEKNNVDAIGTNFSVVLSKSDGVLINSISDDSDGIIASLEEDGSIMIEVFENEDTSNDRVMHVTIVTNINTLTITVNQNKAREATIVSTTYENPVIKQFTYNGNVTNEGIAASVKSLVFEQVQVNTWSNGEITRVPVTGNLTTSDASFSYEITNARNGAYVSSNGNVTANASSSANEENIGTVTPQVTWHNMSSNNSSVTAVVKQDAAVCKFTSNNSKTYTKTGIVYGGETFNVNVTKSSGVEIGTITVSPSSAATATFENGAIKVVVNANPNTTQRNITVTIPTNIGNLTINGVQEALVIQKYFYIGNVTALNRTAFAAITDANLIASAIKTNVVSDTTGTGRSSNIINEVDVSTYYKHTAVVTKSSFFVLIPNNVNIGAAYEIAGGGFNTEYNNADITNPEIWRAVHSDVTIEGVIYKVYGRIDDAMIGNTMELYIK